MSEVEFRVLGPVEVLDGQRVVPVPTGRVRDLLAALLLRANQVVTTKELTEYLWGDAARPPSMRAVQTYVRRLRTALDEPSRGRLVLTTPGGYLIEVGQEQLDLTRFRNLVERARGAADLVEQSDLLERALGLWRGRPLMALSAEVLVREAAPHLAEERLNALERLMDARLKLGRHAEVVAELTALAREHPLREVFSAQLMLALYRCGRQAEALRAYQAVSGLLADELGIDPGGELQRLHRSILRADPNLPFDAAPTPVWRRHSEIEQVRALHAVGVR